MNMIVWIVLIGASSCIPKSISRDEAILEFIGLTIKEPSGLSYSADRQSLLVVSDRGTIFNIEFDGSVRKQYPLVFDDLEGIFVDASDNSIYVVEEQKGQIVAISPEGTILSTTDILDSNDNSGLEGITYDASRDIFYLLKEKNNGLLIKYSFKDKTIQKIDLDFASDYSGIFYNDVTDNLWILSQESQTLNKCDINGKLKTSFFYPITGMEGIVVNDAETEALVVSDPQNSLIRLQIE